MFNTSDMYLASILVAYGGEIESVDKKDRDRQVFHFKTIPVTVWVIDNTDYVKRQVVASVDEIKALVASSKLLYPPNFITAIKSVKSYIYTE